MGVCGLHLPIIMYGCVSDVKYMCMKIHMQHNKFLVVSWMYAMLYVAKFATE